MAKYVIIKNMSRLKKFLIVFLSFLPFSAGVAGPLAVGTIVAIGAVAGFSIYRTAAPVDMGQALEFFSGCWSCQMFSDIMYTMSTLLPKAYDALARIVFPTALFLTIIWYAGYLVGNFFNAKLEEPWALASKVGSHFFKLFFVGVLLLWVPLPRMISTIAIEPIFNVGLSLNRLVSQDDKFDECVVATAVASTSANSQADLKQNAYPPKLRYNLACELAGVHQMTGLGMTVGWTMLNMAFHADYMHKIVWEIPIFPNVPIFLAGALIFLLFALALLPVPLYFLEIFIKLSMDLIMLPLMLLSWLFQGWKIALPGAGKTIRGIIDDVINGTLGLAATGIFVSFAITFLNAMFGDGKWDGSSALQTALTNNDSEFLMDALMLNNDSYIKIAFLGVFLFMLMTMIPTLSKSLFNIHISSEYYESAKKDVGLLWGGIKKLYKKI